MRKDTLLLLERIAVVIIVGAVSYALFFSLSGGGDIALDAALDAVFVTISALMIISLVKNLREYSKTGFFLSVPPPDAHLGIAAHIVWKICWLCLCAACILVNHSDNERLENLATLILGLWLITLIPAAALRIGFYARRKNILKGKPDDPMSYRWYFGSGEGTHLKMTSAQFNAQDGYLTDRFRAVTNGRLLPPSDNTPPTAVLLREEFAFSVLAVQAGSLESAAALTENTVLKHARQLCERLGYDAGLDPEDWKAIITSSADQWVLNRLAGGVDISYYVLSCLDMLLFAHGLSVAEITNYDGMVRFAVILRSEDIPLMKP